MPSPHDQFVKSFLSSPSEAIDFFDSSLPKSITNLLHLEKLEPTKESFIGAEHDSKIYSQFFHSFIGTKTKG